MNRLLFPLLFLLSFLAPRQGQSQGFAVWLDPTGGPAFNGYMYACKNPTANNTTTAGVIAAAPGANTYSWVVLSPTNCGSSATYTPIGDQNDSLYIEFPCCGNYTVYTAALFTTSTGTFPVTADTTIAFLACVNSLTATAGAQVICLTNTVNLFGNGAQTYTWYPGGITGNPIVVSPTACTDYTVIGTTPSSQGGCTVTNNVNVCVQGATAVIAPTTQSMCLNSPVCFTVTAGALGSPSFAPGTLTTGVEWFYPGGGTPFSTNNSACTNATVGGNYYAVVTHSGQAGVCTTTALTTVIIAPNISMSASSNTAQVCPGGTVQLTAVSNQTNPAAYSWTSSATGQVLTGNPVTFTQNATSGPVCYYVSVDYFGCPGTATVCVGVASLTPVISLSSPSICPGSTVMLSASGGSTYTYSYFCGGYIPIAPTNTPGPVVHTPTCSPGPFPALYKVDAYSNGCTGSAFVTVYSLTLRPTITASTPSTCPNRQFTLTARGGGGTTFTFVSCNNSVLPKAPSINTVVTTAPNLPCIYTVNADSLGCSGSATYTMGVLDLSPRITLMVTPSAFVCPGTIFTITASNHGSAANYTFTSPAGSHTVIPPRAIRDSLTSFPGTYLATVDSLGCVGSKTIAVFERTLFPVISATPQTVCSGMPVRLHSTGGTGTKYTFLRPDPNTVIAVVGNIKQTSPTATHTPGPSVATAYTVVVDSARCLGRDSIQVNIAPGLSVTAVASTQTVCSGVTATISAFGPTNSIYSWSQITGTNPSIPVPNGVNLSYTAAAGGITVNPQADTQYIVYAVDPAGCTGTAAVTISVNPTASLTILVSPTSNTICTGTSATLSASGANSYSWYPTSNLTPSALVPTVAANPPIDVTYTVVGSNNLGCYGSATVFVHVGQIPQLTAPPTAYSVCPGFNATITAFGAQTYTWTGNPTSGTMAPVPQQSVAVGPGCYTVVGSNGGTCTNTLSTCIGTLAPMQIKVAASSPTTCIASNFPKFSQPVTYTASGAGSYVWQPYNPAYMTYSLGSITTVRPPASTCFTVTGYTSVCAGQTVVCTTVVPQFSMNVTPPLPAICVGDSIQLSVVNISSLAVGKPSDMKYRWEEPDNAILSLSEKLVPVVMAYPQTTATYTVEVADARQCVSLPKLVTVTVFPRPMTAILIPTINNVPTNTVCYVGVHTGPPDVVLTLEGVNMNPSLPFGVVPTYTWLQPYKAPINSILTPANYNQVTISAPLRLPTDVTYTLVSGFNGVPGCAELNTVSIHVIDCRPVATVTNDIFSLAEEADTICAMECITFMSLTDTMAGGPQQYEWTFEGGSPPSSTEKNPTVCYNLPGYYDVILKVTNPYPVANGGSSKQIGKHQFARVVDIPNVSIVAPGGLKSDTTVRFGTPIKLTASGGLTYKWSPNYNISSLTEKNVTVKPFRSTRYILTGYNSKNCASRDTIDVIVIEDCGEMFVPNAFSPNGDGHNELLKVNGICLQTLSFMIFNRWGEKVFETNDQSVGWDGTYKGELMNTGVFVYRLEGKTYDGKAYSAKGNITLIR